MKMVLLRVGVDSGSGGIQGPLFPDGSFDFVPIPDNSGYGLRTYGNTLGVKGVPLSEYFPKGRQNAIHGQSMHVDPEFETFTYGDPTAPKAGLRRLQRGDMLVFYAGLSGWGYECEPALYLVGYFMVEWAGLATDLPWHELKKRCGKNFHVMHDELYRQQRERLVLVQGGPGSRLLTRAHCISAISCNKMGQPLKVLSPSAQKIFGDFDGRISIQRSPPRWVHETHVNKAKTFWSLWSSFVPADCEFSIRLCRF
ncbi:hypothetical protein LP414_09345 [Polaromonas sp. P1(28)-13]|nr:hypothetical protein LP414_09345 [Polaromonas sp. P1(28)-13]